MRQEEALREYEVGRIDKWCKTHLDTSDTSAGATGRKDSEDVARVERKGGS